MFKIIQNYTVFSWSIKIIFLRANKSVKYFLKTLMKAEYFIKFENECTILMC